MTNNILKTIYKFRIPKIVKRIFNLFGGLLLSACCLFGSYLTYKNGWTDLKKVDKFEGVIIEKGIITYQSSTSGRYLVTSTRNAFYLKLKGLNQILAIYNPQQTYDSLDNNLNIGDTVKVFYNHSNLVDKINLETFQIEKNNREILNSQDFQGRERIGFYITFIGGFVLLFLTIYQDRKFKLNERNLKKALPITNAIANAGLRVR